MNLTTAFTYEAKRIAHDLNAPSCTDINRLDEFLFP